MSKINAITVRSLRKTVPIAAAASTAASNVFCAAASATILSVTLPFGLVFLLETTIIFITTLYIYVVAFGLRTVYLEFNE